MNFYFYIVMKIAPILLLFIFPIFAPAQNLDIDKVLAHLELLASDSLQGRKSGTEGSLMAQAYIIDQFSKAGVAAYFPDYKQNFSFGHGRKSIEGTNIVGYIEGNYEATIVISAHYDHLGMQDSLVFNGADDNASGVAALLEIASYFSSNQPDHTLVFCAFDAEELGLEGSKAFINSSAVDPTQIALIINMDMISRSEKGILYAVGTRQFPYFKDFIPLGQDGDYSVETGHDDPSKPSENWTFSSDHAPFFNKNIPFIYFGVDDHEDYHKLSDNYESIHPEFYGFTVEKILETILNLDKALIEDNDEE